MHNITQRSNVSVTNIVKVLLGIIALFAGAQITIPIQPVAITLHTLVIMIIGLTYSRKEAVATITSLYITRSYGCTNVW
ncbi:MAG UNVERIFIED_CONTAM: hypothetical protein LVQ98_08815 [Rickettsiaceae bacterium]|jgi:biotin transport system substrate-specific component